MRNPLVGVLEFLYYYSINKIHRLFLSESNYDTIF
jgi:hypothetical protein